MERNAITVRELIARLQALPQDLEVALADWVEGVYTPHFEWANDIKVETRSFRNDQGIVEPVTFVLFGTD